MKFHHWTHLNEEGKKLFETVFPDGIVPVRSMLPSTMKLGGQPQIAFKVDLKQLSKKQLNQLLESMSKKFHAPKTTIRKQIEKDGFIPLRQSLTSSAGTDQPGLFI